VTVVELRCPLAEPWGLMGKIRLAGGAPRIVEDNLIELHCPSCTRQARRAGRPIRVLHRFNILGELVETERVPT
jgi:hypothetical protein